MSTLLALVAGAVFAALTLLGVLAASLLENPAAIGLIVGIPASVLGFLAYRRTAKLDKIAKGATDASNRSAEVGQVIDGLNAMIDNLQADNKVLRDGLADLTRLHAKLEADYDTLKASVERIDRTVNGGPGT